MSNQPDLYGGTIVCSVDKSKKAAAVTFRRGFCPVLSVSTATAEVSGLPWASLHVQKGFLSQDQTERVPRKGLLNLEPL